MDQPMLAAALLFSASAAHGSVVGIREDVPGEPLGRRSPGRVATQVALGLGCGTAAPWPMPAATLVAAAMPGHGSRLPARICLGIGAACVAGVLSEPITWGLRPRSRAVGLAIALHLGSGVALVGAGRRALRAPRDRRR